MTRVHIHTNSSDQFPVPLRTIPLGRNGVIVIGIVVVIVAVTGRMASQDPEKTIIILSVMAGPQAHTLL